jgi:hypothetical protein
MEFFLYIVDSVVNLFIHTYRFGKINSATRIEWRLIEKLPADWAEVVLIGAD